MSAAPVGDAASAPAPSASTAIPFKPAQAEASAGLDFPVAFVACLVLLAAAIFVLRRWGPRAMGLRGTGRAVEVIESTRLRDKTCVSVIRYKGRELLVAHSEHAIAVLADDAAAAEAAGEEHAR